MVSDSYFFVSFFLYLYFQYYCERKKSNTQRYRQTNILTSNSSTYSRLREFNEREKLRMHHHRRRCVFVICFSSVLTCFPIYLGRLIRSTNVSLSVCYPERRGKTSNEEEKVRDSLIIFIP